MSYADVVFKDTVNDILENGTTTEGQEVRPHWPDGTQAYTVKKFGVVNRYDLRKEFPAITLRRMGLKSAFDEILWIYQRKSNNIHDLNSSIWDEWADETGSIHKAYGYQMAKKNECGGINEKKLLKAFPNVKAHVITLTGPEWTRTYYIDKDVEADGTDIDVLNKIAHAIYDEKDGKGVWLMDQVDKAIFDLMNTPYSRRIMTTTWCPEDLADMNLEPCAYSMTYNVTDDHREDGKLTLNAILNQRSQDMLAANGWNIAQYALLLMMIAQTCDMVPGELVHVIADCHIYDRHVPLIKTLLTREGFAAPKVYLNPEVKDFYKFTVDDLIIEDYQYGEQIKDIPIAI